MRNKTTVVLLVIFVLFIIYSLKTDMTGFSTAAQEIRIDDKILNEINEKGEADVIVILKDSRKLSSKRVSQKLSSDELEKKHEYKLVNGFSGRISAEGLEKLKHDPNVEKIYTNKKYQISLTDSLPLINATKLQPYQINNINITGVGETICILDTGIDYTHESFGACTSIGNGCKIVGGYDFVNNDTDPYDDHGHGTHVAGIAAANGLVTGIAPGANIAMVKVCDSGGSCTSANLLSALEWCVTNKELYNISVISMSLGDGGQYTTSTCPLDSIDEGLTAAFNAGIFITAAAGNNGYTSGVSHPACNSNVAAAGASNNDGIAYNRGGDVLTILAPGVSITSTWPGGNTVTLSGTSMSTPFIAGAAAILQQYAKASTGLLTQSEIKDALNSTGKAIYDSSSGGTYSRIDLYEAVKSLTDSLGPSLNLVSPSNMTYNIIESLPLSYIVNDINDIDTVWYNLDEGPNIILSEDTEFDTTEGSHVLSLHANDSLGNENLISVFFTTDVTEPVVTLIGEEESYSTNPVVFEFSLTEQNPDSCSLYGSWNDWHLNQTKPATETSFTLNLPDGNHVWNVECNDTTGSTAFADDNYTVSVDSTPPIIDLAVPQNTTYPFLDLELEFTLTEDNIDSCWYNMDGNINMINGCDNTSLDVSEGSHNIVLFANDSTNNVNYDEVSFTTDVTNPVVNLESPLDNSFSNSKSVQFTFKAIDNTLNTCNLYGNWNDWHVNQTKTGITSGELTTFDEIILEDGSYVWNVECIDDANNAAFNTTNHTFTIDPTQPILTLVLPENTVYFDNSSLQLSFSLTEINIDSCWYNINDGTNTTIVNCENTTITTPYESNNLKIYAKDLANNEAVSEKTFTVDIYYPAITLSSPANDVVTQSPASFNYTVEDIGLANCSLLINGTINSTDDTITTSIIQEFSTELTKDNYYWSVSCVDNGNKGTVSEERNFIICNEQWNCTEWNTCSNSQQTRTCTDSNTCGTNYTKPSETQTCSSESAPSVGFPSGPSSSGTTSSGGEAEETVETPTLPKEQPETKPVEEQKPERPAETPAITETVKEEGFLSKTLNFFKNLKDYITHPKQTATSISTKAVEGAKNHKIISITSFVFIISTMILTHFYFFKRYRARKLAEEEMPIPLPPKVVKKSRMKKTSVTKETQEQPETTEAKGSFFQKFNPFKSYKDLIGPKKPFE